LNSVSNDEAVRVPPVVNCDVREIGMFDIIVIVSVFAGKFPDVKLIDPVPSALSDTV
tara:strand:- start:179 stop:349 length:171 start_codon:yes stop_codon:yes gene_type:complete